MNGSFKGPELRARIFFWSLPLGESMEFQQGPVTDTVALRQHRSADFQPWWLIVLRISACHRKGLSLAANRKAFRLNLFHNSSNAARFKASRPWKRWIKRRGGRFNGDIFTQQRLRRREPSGMSGMPSGLFLMVFGKVQTGQRASGIRTDSKKERDQRHNLSSYLPPKYLLQSSSSQTQIKS